MWKLDLSSIIVWARNKLAPKRYAPYMVAQVMRGHGWLSERSTSRLIEFVYADPKTSSRLTTRPDGDNTWRVIGAVFEVVFDGVFYDVSL